MFGLNDDDKNHVNYTQPQVSQDDQSGSDDSADSQNNDQHDSPFAAAYSSLNGSSDNDAPAVAPKIASGPVPEEDLLQLKTQALQSLAPLIDHLDQSPEEKFKTTMMMIQASDNADLIRDAYTAANRIQDDKDRAQALLDVINEINYFTQRGKS